MYLIPDWAEKQHYKDRSPPWIKLHKNLLTSYRFQHLQVASKALAPMLWLIASDTQDGHLTSSHQEIAWKVNIPLKVVDEAIKDLISNGYIVLVQDASNSLADCQQLAIPERERERERETETEEKYSGKQKRITKRTFPDDWQPHENHREKCQQAGLDPDGEREAFRDHHIARGNTFKDWDAAFNTWIRNAIKFSQSRKAGGNVNGHNRQQPRSRAELTAEVIRDMEKDEQDGQGRPIFDDMEELHFEQCKLRAS